MASLGNLTVGSSIFLNVDNVPTEFMVVHQGLPSSEYDSSCDGTWVLAKDIYTIMAFDSGGDNDYATSEIRAWLDGTFLSSLDSDVQSKVLQVKIPYVKSGSVLTGSSGISSKVFLLSGGEVSSTQLDYTVGSRLSYFADDSKTKRIAYYNGTATIYYLRNPGREADPDRAHCVDAGGSTYAQRLVADSTKFGIRPAMVLDPSLLVDSSGNIVFANFQGYVNIQGAWREIVAGYSKVNNEWRAITAGYSNVDSEWRDDKVVWAKYEIYRVYEPSTFGSSSSFSNPSSSNPYLMASQAKKDSNGNVDWGTTYTATSSTTLRNNYTNYPYCSMASTLDADNLYKITSASTMSRQRQKVTEWAVTSESLGSYIENVKGKPGDYPDNGIQDGYWYIKQE